MMTPAMMTMKTTVMMRWIIIPRQDDDDCNIIINEVNAEKDDIDDGEPIEAEDIIIDNTGLDVVVDEVDEPDPPVNCRVILNTVNKKKKMKKAVMQWQWTKKENNDNIW